MSDWSEVLDRYEAALDAHDAALAAGVPQGEGGPAWPPDRLPPDPLPFQHRARAEALLARTTELARRAAMARDALPRPTAAGRRPHPVRPATGGRSWLDTSL